MDHNFKDVEFGFAKIDGEEIIGIDCCISSGGCSISNVGSGAMFGSEVQMHEQRRVNARRITACINYCKDLSTEELEA